MAQPLILKNPLCLPKMESRQFLCNLRPGCLIGFIANCLLTSLRNRFCRLGLGAWWWMPAMAAMIPEQSGGRGYVKKMLIWISQSVFPAFYVPGELMW